jgi:UDP-glucose 4-epimerase
MRVLVTGGAGYIGSTATEMLIAAGHEVTVLDDLSTGHRSNVHPDAYFVEGSITEKGACHQALTGVEAVLHFAAKSLVGESVEKPEKYWSTNVGGTRTLLDQMREFGVKRLVFSSTAATYGEPEEVPIKETSSTKPTNPYGASKLAVDMMITGEAKAHGVHAISLRYFNVAGALKTDNKSFGKGSGWIAELHNPETHLIPNVLASSEKSPVKIFGKDWPTPDKTCIRDYVHVVDLVNAHIKALDLLMTKSAGESAIHQIFNLGSGGGYSVQEVVDACSKAIGHAIPTVDAPRRAGDPAVLIADISHAGAVLEWKPEKNIEDMVSDAHEALTQVGKI